MHGRVQHGGGLLRAAGELQRVPRGVVHLPGRRGLRDDLTPSLSGTNIRCEDLVAYIGDVSACSATTFPSNEEGLAEGCFDYNTYCKCAANTWACNNSACSYTAPCTTDSRRPCRRVPQRDANEPRPQRDVQPLRERDHRLVPGRLRDRHRIAPAPSRSAPATRAARLDAGGADCSCNQSACYFKCSKDIDCASGSTCDATTSLCKQSGCMTSADCVQSTGNPRAQCNANACQIPCANDVAQVHLHERLVRSAEHHLLERRLQGRRVQLRRQLHQQRPRLLRDGHFDPVHVRRHQLTTRTERE